MSVVLMLSLLFHGADFPVCTVANQQQGPTPIFTNGYFYVFWSDERIWPTDSIKSLFAARITNDGTVIDPDGKILFSDKVRDKPAVALEDTNIMVIFTNG